MKLPYEQLHIEVERLYARRFPEDADEAINEHCGTITALIEASGWTVDEYMARYLQDRSN